MKNPFLTLLEDPASLIIVEFDNAEKRTIVRMLEEKVNNAIAAYDNPEQHDDAIYNPFNEWLYYLNEMWNGKLDYTFEQWAYTIGLQKYELYKMILGLLADKHLDYVCEHETNVDDDMLNNVMGMDVLDELDGLTIRNDSRINRDTNIDNDTLNSLKINR